MTQQAVEQAIGKLTTDAGFRARFFADAGAASWEAGLPLSPVELEALSALSRRAVLRFSRALDPRIIRLCIEAAPPPPPTAHPSDHRSGDSHEPPPAAS